ncbi:MAG: D-2-hydroxyacid dehydrogenase [Acidimicrobiales bacterium]
MPVRPVPTDGPINLGILYPTVWFGDPDALAREIETVQSIDPRIAVTVETYDEPHELRTERGRIGGAEAARGLAPALTDAQRAMFERVDAVVTLDLPFDVGAVAPKLGWVQGVGAGSAQLQSAGLAEAGIRLTTSAGSNAVAIAEFVIGRLLQERKRFRELDALQQVHNWDALYGSELAGATVGLIGLGAINAAVAARLAPFGVTVLASRRSARPGATAPDVAELFPTDQLHDMLGRCDTIVSAVPETPETIGLIDAAAIAAMKPGAFFCNVGRGTLLDEDALIDAMRRGHLRGAALDVASIEPLPSDHPLWDAPNLYLSYHCSSSPAALFVNLHRLWRDNIKRWLSGEPLRNEVDLERGY